MRARSAAIESGLLVLTLIVSYAAVFIAASAEGAAPEGSMSMMRIAFISIGVFFLSFGIAIVSVMAGIGGGVLFTPIMLAFTSVDSLIVRATGLIVAMFSGLVSSGPHLRSGLANFRISSLLAASYGVGAFGGAMGAIYVAGALGEVGEGFVRFALGLILAGLGVYFFTGGKNVEWPEVREVGRFTGALNLSLPFHERSLGRVVHYQVARAGWAMALIAGVGLLSGFFGLGAGWAIVPTQNLVMGVPLKVAAANSSVLIGMGDCIAIWPYLLSGAVIPLFVAPWLAGIVLGGIVGARLLANVKAGFVRIILIGIMFITSFGLISRGLSMFGVIPPVPMYATWIVILAAGAWVVFAARGLDKPAGEPQQPEEPQGAEAYAVSPVREEDR